MKKRRQLKNYVYAAVMSMVIATTIICIVTVYVLNVSINEELFNRKQDAMNLYTNLIHETIEEPLKLLDSYYDRMTDQLILEDFYKKHFSYVEMSDIPHDSTSETSWSQTYIHEDHCMIFEKNFEKKRVTVKMAFDDVYKILNNSNHDEVTILNESGMVLGKAYENIQDLPLDILDPEVETLQIVDKKYIIKAMPYLNWYMVINYQSEVINRKIQKIILQVLSVWMSISAILMLLTAYTMGKVQEDIVKIEKRTFDIGEGEYALAPSDFVYEETYKIDHLLFEMGQMVEERSIEIHAMNAQLEELVEERTSEVLIMNRKLEEEIKDRKEIESEIRSINRSLDRTVHERTDELTRLNQELMKNITIANEANDAKSKFLAVMSHEMRTPLNAIIGFAHMLTLDIHDPHQRKTLDMVMNSSKVLLSLINDVLDFAKYESGKMTFESYTFNLKQEVNEILEPFGVLCDNKGLEFFSSGLDEVNYYVKSDATKVKQVFNNILNNALKFTKEGHISVEIHSTLNQDMIYMDVHIKDTGVGMSLETQEQLFEPFVQGKEAVHTHGTGLGVAITKEIIENLQGVIVYDSTLDVGTTCRFNMKLPLSEKDLEPISEKIPTLEYTKILYVEDNMVNQKLMSQFFNKYKVDFDIANHGLDALEKFKKGHYDLIFMDLQMPVMDGYEATEKIRAIDESVMIFAMTAYTTKDVKEKCLEVGMNDYISKPVDLKYLSAILGLELEEKIHRKKLNDSYIDEHARELSQIIQFDYDVSRELLRTFIEQLKSAMNKIDDWVAEKNYEELKRIIHKMKGGASTVRLEEILLLLDKGEGCVLEDDLNGLMEIIEELKLLDILKE